MVARSLRSRVQPREAKSSHVRITDVGAGWRSAKGALAASEAAAKFGVLDR